MTNEPLWLQWARQIQAIAQTGKHYTQDPFDAERFNQLEALAAEIFAQYSSAQDPAHWAALFGKEEGYTTPKIDVRGVVFNRQGEILLVRETFDGGRWTLPGGWADINTAPSANVEREVLEESGYVVRATKLLALYDRRLHGHPPTPFHSYRLWMRCELLQDTPIPSPQGDLESSESGWFAEESLPAEHELSTSRVTLKQLGRCFEHARNPQWLADFD